METASKGIGTALRRGRFGPVSGKTLLLCSDLLVVCDETGWRAPPGCGTLYDVVRNAELSRRAREGKGLAAPG
jgi:hypothetical protein